MIYMDAATGAAGMKGQDIMERIGFDLKYGYIWNRQSDNGDLVYLQGIGWVRKPA